MSQQSTIENEIKLTSILEDFVLKRIKFPLGDRTKEYAYWNSVRQNTATPLIAPIFEITETDKTFIYEQHAQGKYKETDQEYSYRTTYIPQEDGSKYLLYKGMPTFYDDILTALKEFFEYIQSSENVDLKQVTRLRKKAFHTYALHYDCLSIQSLPKEIYIYFEKIKNGRQKNKSDDVIKVNFLQYAEKILLNQDEAGKITSICKDKIIDDLTTASIPSIKQALIENNESKCLILSQSIETLLQLRESAWLHDKPNDHEPIAYFFGERDRKYFKDLIRTSQKRISQYEKQTIDLKEPSNTSAKCNIRKKFSGNSETWLKQHVVDGQSLYQRIKEIVKNNKQCSYLKK